MVRGNALTSKKEAPADESNFIHTGDIFKLSDKFR